MKKIQSTSEPEYITCVIVMHTRTARNVLRKQRFVGLIFVNSTYSILNKSIEKLFLY